MIRRFTGYHMTAILVGFFAIVIAVNLLMANYAISTFGGTVVDNSYVASQDFNHWLKAARAQDALGWSATMSLDGQRHPELRAKGSKPTLAGITATGVAEHPLGRAPDIALTFAADSRGVLRAAQTLPAGRWNVRVALADGGDTVRLLDNLQ